MPEQASAETDGGWEEEGWGG